MAAPKLKVPRRPAYSLDTTQKRPSVMPAGHVKHYTTGHVYIFDDVDSNAGTSNRSERQHIHEANCDNIRRFFAQNTAYHIHSVRHSRTSFQEFLTWWYEELEQRSSDELVIVYFNGEATGKGLEYKWNFVSSPNEVNAWQIMKATNESGRDCMYMLDCPFPSRSGPKDPVVPRRKHGHSDYTIAGQAQLNANKTINYESTYTARITKFMPLWARLDDMKKCDENMRLSMPEIMRYDFALSSNPIRVWEKKTSKKSKQRVYRLCIEVNTSMRTRQLEWVRVRIQGPPDEDDPDYEEYDEETDPDSGYDELGENEDDTREEEADDEGHDEDDAREGGANDQEHEEADVDSNAAQLDVDNTTRCQESLKTVPQPIVQIKKEDEVIVIKDKDEDIKFVRLVVHLERDDTIKQETGALVPRSAPETIDLTQSDDVDMIDITEFIPVKNEHDNLPASATNADGLFMDVD